jgi:hypothetical protein
MGVGLADWRSLLQGERDHLHVGSQEAAKTLNISYRALLYKIRDAGLPPNRARRQAEAAKGGVAAE